MSERCSLFAAFQPADGVMRLIVVCGLTIGAAFVAGCGSNGDSGGDSGQEDGSQEQSTGQTETQSDSPGSEQSANSRDAGDQVVRTDEQGRKWLGKIPYDVWYQDPLAVASNDQQADTADSGGGESKQSSSASPADMDTGEDSEQAADGGAGASGHDWKSLISVDTLEAETKKIRNFLTQGMQTVGQYNGKYKQIRMYAGTLAAVAGIVRDHPEPIGWKENAPYVRDLAKKIHTAAEAPGRKYYEKARLPYEQLIDLLNGSSPGGLSLEEPDPDVSLAERADRGAVMKRMEQSFEWVKKNVGDAETLKSQADKAAHESSLLAALTRVIAMPGYKSADAEGYQKEARGMIDAGLQMSEAVQSEDFQMFQNGVNKAQNRCNECHTEYRFADLF